MGSDPAGQNAALLHVDLGTGLGGWTEPFRDSDLWRSVGVDIRDDLEADIVGDIRHLPIGASPDLLTMSPPCTEFSRWMLPWLDEPNPDLSLVEACLDVVEELEPEWWALENSRGLHQYWRDADQHVGPFYLWGNLPPIEADVPHGKMQVSGERPEERAKIPYELADAVRREAEQQRRLIADGGQPVEEDSGAPRRSVLLGGFAVAGAVGWFLFGGGKKGSVAAYGNPWCPSEENLADSTFLTGSLRVDEIVFQPGETILVTVSLHNRGGVAATFDRNLNALLWDAEREIVEKSVNLAEVNRVISPESSATLTLDVSAPDTPGRWKLDMGEIAASCDLRHSLAAEIEVVARG